MDAYQEKVSEAPHTCNLHIHCPHCSVEHVITEWPRDETTPILFTCLAKRGGCAGKSIVQPPDVGNFSGLEEVFVPGYPLTKEEASRLEICIVKG